MKAKLFSILFVVFVTVYSTAGTALGNETTIFEPLSYRSALAAPSVVADARTPSSPLNGKLTCEANTAQVAIAARRGAPWRAGDTRQGLPASVT